MQISVPSRRLFRRLIHVGVACSLASCAAPNLLSPLAERQQQTTPWRIVHSSQALVNVADPLIVLRRFVGRVEEQRIALPNKTALPGDNFIHISAVPRERPFALNLKSVMDRVGGLPPPFTARDLQSMRSSDDAAGAITWAQWTNGTGIECVLAIRRVPEGARMMPRGAGALDLAMRNCIHGTANQALAPLGPEAVLAFGQSASSTRKQTYTLSPLAGPAQ